MLESEKCLKCIQIKWFLYNHATISTVVAAYSRGSISTITEIPTHYMRCRLNAVAFWFLFVGWEHFAYIYVFFFLCSSFFILFLFICVYVRVCLIVTNFSFYSLAVCRYRSGLTGYASSSVMNFITRCIHFTYADRYNTIRSSRAHKTQNCRSHWSRIYIRHRMGTRQAHFFTLSYWIRFYLIHIIRCAFFFFCFTLKNSMVDRMNCILHVVVMS